MKFLHILMGLYQVYDRVIHFRSCRPLQAEASHHAFSAHSAGAKASSESILAHARASACWCHTNVVPQRYRPLHSSLECCLTHSCVAARHRWHNPVVFPQCSGAFHSCLECRRAHSCVAAGCTNGWCYAVLSAPSLRSGDHEC